MRPIVGPPGSGAQLELCGTCARRLRRFTLELPPDLDAVDYRAIPLSCVQCGPPMVALVRATSTAQRGARRTPEEQREALAAFKSAAPLMVLVHQPAEPEPHEHDWQTFQVAQVMPCCEQATQRVARMCRTCKQHEEVAP